MPKYLVTELDGSAFEIEADSFETVGLVTTFTKGKKTVATVREPRSIKPASAVRKTD